MFLKYTEKNFISEITHSFRIGHSSQRCHINFDWSIPFTCKPQLRGRDIHSKKLSKDRTATSIFFSFFFPPLHVEPSPKVINCPSAVLTRSCSSKYTRVNKQVNYIIHTFVYTNPKSKEGWATFTSRQGSLTMFFSWETMPALRSFSSRPNAPGIEGKVRLIMVQTTAARSWLSLLCRNLIRNDWVPLSTCGTSRCITASLWKSFPLVTLQRTYIP